MKKASEILRETKEFLMEHGWCTGSYQHDEYDSDAWEGEVFRTTYCIMGGFGMVMNQDSHAYEGRGGSYDMMTWMHPLRCLWETMGRPETIESWNDTTGRTFDEVCDVFDRAEKLALVREETP